MRFRNPCTRLRYRFLGWKVRLMVSPLESEVENRGSVPEGVATDRDSDIVT